MEYQTPPAAHWPKAKTIATKNLPASNLVFLIDVSGSMNSANKLPLVQSSLKNAGRSVTPAG
jgi:uncharacterized protein with von Willebrand factor type A (vWA) domain